MKIENGVKEIIGFGKPCDKCKQCYEFNHKGCRGMSQICYGFKKDNK